ncbi:hypothetical protein [Mesorhizobium australicum]|uniref:DUF5615 domain-containing protein n=1 Tax=Mesorhizobium australicum TaxID=536018 RepID=A0A1X7NVF6_9HYPH|nr:hypothetical protein [Mesorhizobium australicum]SMH41442.1 hypothetical protein SAMN02982922_2572 [Mesorhizobium australicum]
MIEAQLDESVPRQLARALEPFGIRARPFPQSWKGLADGDLLDRIESLGCSVFITCDGHMQSQQSLGRRSFAVITIPTNRRRTVIVNAAKIAELARHAAPGSHSVVDVS